MYIQCKQGFIEADRWDGQRIPVEAHQKVVERLAKKPNQTVIVLRSRERATLADLVGRVADRRKVYESPQGWDYQFRAYVTSGEWAAILSTIVGDLDYRNFKSWCTANKPKDHRLAHDIWHAAHDAGKVTRTDFGPPLSTPSPYGWQPLRKG